MKVTFSESGWVDYVYWQQQDKKTIKRINLLIQDIQRNGYGGLGKPEPLRGDFAGFWSKRIDDDNRLVYRLKDGGIGIVQCREHYGDK